MKKTLFTLLAFSTLNVFSNDTKVPDDAFLIDTIEVVAFGQGGTEIVTLSDVLRPSLTGEKQSKDDIIFERLVYLDAQKFKIVPDEEGVDRYLAEIQKQNNLTLDKLKRIFQQAGYSYQEGREQFKRLQTVKTMMDFKISSNLIVPRKQVEKYYNEHPVKEEGSYYLRHGVVPFNDNKEQQEKELIAFAQTGKNDPGIEWENAYWYKKSELPDDKEFIFSMQRNEISKPVKIDGRYELYQLVDKKEERITPLDERYTDIVNILSRPKYEQLMKKYKKQLFDSVSILYF